MRHALRRLGLATATFTVLGVLMSSHRAEADDIFVLLSGYGAKEGCSCVFVVEQADDYCKTFAQASVYPVDLTIDHTAKTVTATNSATPRVARFTEGAGCTLDKY